MLMSSFLKFNLKELHRNLQTWFFCQCFLNCSPISLCAHHFTVIMHLASFGDWIHQLYIKKELPKASQKHLNHSLVEGCSTAHKTSLSLDQTRSWDIIKTQSTPQINSPFYILCDSSYHNNICLVFHMNSVLIGCYINRFKSQDWAGECEDRNVI